MTTRLIDVPPGLNGVAVTSTEIGDVRGEEGFFHYRQYDAVALAEQRSFEDVWHLVARGSLPDGPTAAAFRSEIASRADLPAGLAPIVATVAAAHPSPLDGLRTVLSLSAPVLSLRPLIDSTPEQWTDGALSLCALVPGVAAALSRATRGLPPVEAVPEGLGVAASYLFQATGEVPSAAVARALEQYLILTIDHGFNASTFTARVVASTGADLAAVVTAAMGALSGPLHGGAPSRALDALDAIGDPANAPSWVEHEVAAGRRIMGFGHAVYRTADPRSRLLRQVAEGLGGPLVDRAEAVEREIERTLDRLKPGRPLATNVEYYAGVVMERCGLPRDLFTPTFAISRTIGWCAHALEQAAEHKLIRPSCHYVGPQPDAPVPPAVAA
jgi:citrate synthase